jgi:hypothetical protein
MNRPAALLLLFAAPALAQSSSELEGIYLAAGGGGGLLIAGDHSSAWDVEARLGYSFSPGTQIYLAGSLDGGMLSAASRWRRSSSTTSTQRRAPR